MVAYTYDGNGNRLAETTGAGTVTAIYDAQDRLVSYGATTYTHTQAGEAAARGRTRRRGRRHTPMTRSEIYEVLRCRPGHWSLCGGWRQPPDWAVYERDVHAGLPLSGTAPAGCGSGRIGRRARRASSMLSVRNVPTTSCAAAPRIKSSLTTSAVRGSSLTLPQVPSYRNSTTTPSGARCWIPIRDFSRSALPANCMMRPRVSSALGTRDTTPQRAGAFSADPIGFGGGDANLHAYVANDPVNRIDVTGLDRVERRCRERRIPFPVLAIISRSG